MKLKELKLRLAGTHLLWIPSYKSYAPVLAQLCSVLYKIHTWLLTNTHIHRLAGSHLFASQSFSPGLAAAHFSGAPIMTVKSISKTAYYVHRLYCEFSFTSKWLTCLLGNGNDLKHSWCNCLNINFPCCNNNFAWHKVVDTFQLLLFQYLRRVHAVNVSS